MSQWSTTAPSSPGPPPSHGGGGGRQPAAASYNNNYHNNKSPRTMSTPPPPSSPSRTSSNNNRYSNNTNTTMNNIANMNMNMPSNPFANAQPSTPTATATDPSRQIMIAAPNNNNGSSINPQWQIIHPNHNSSGSHSHSPTQHQQQYNRRHPPPPPPPRTNSNSNNDGTNNGAAFEFIASAERNLQRAYSAGSETSHYNTNTNTNTRAARHESGGTSNENTNNNVSRRKRSSSFGTSSNNNTDPSSSNQDQQQQQRDNFNNSFHSRGSRASASSHRQREHSRHNTDPGEGFGVLLSSSSFTSSHGSTNRGGSKSGSRSDGNTNTNTRRSRSGSFNNSYGSKGSSNRKSNSHRSKSRDRERKSHRSKSRESRSGSFNNSYGSKGSSNRKSNSHRSKSRERRQHRSKSSSHHRSKSREERSSSHRSKSRERDLPIEIYKAAAIQVYCDPSNNNQQQQQSQNYSNYSLSNTGTGGGGGGVNNAGYSNYSLNDNNNNNHTTKNSSLSNNNQYDDDQQSTTVDMDEHDQLGHEQRNLENGGANNNDGDDDDGSNDDKNNGPGQGSRNEEHMDADEGEHEEEPKSMAGKLCSALLCIFPKVEPLPWGTFSMLTLWCAIPPACFILFFTQMGFGEQIYYSIAIEMGHHANVLAFALAVISFVLYMLDADEWSSRAGSIFLDACILAIVCGSVLLVLMIADRFPYGMVCLFAVFHPLWLLALKLMFYEKKDTRTFVSWLSGPLFFVSILILVIWVIWVFSDADNEWNIVARVVAAERTGCVPNYEGNEDCRKEAGSDETCFYVEKYDSGKEELVFPDGCDQSCTAVYNDCLNGFILWVGPILVSMTSFFLSFFCTFLRTEGAREKDVLNFGALWIFILFALWVTTSLAGTAAGVTSALAALTLASFVASAMFIAVSFSKEERSQNAGAVLERLRTKYGKHLDIARGLFVVTCAPLVLVYLGFSVTNQMFRRCRIFPCSQPPGDEGDIFTVRTRKQVDSMKSWDRANVYTYAIYWGIAFMILQVLVANLTVVFLSWIIEKTADFGVAAITAIMCAVGVAMFLLPPVPGVPVYLTLGIVLPAQGHKVFGWIGAIAYSIGIGLLLKLFSSALQQKGIGENLSHYVRVRQFVGINSTFMKAGRLVLGKKGLSVPKVAILIGGPDWPTSVLCGIMRLSVLQIMLGTTPIVFLIAPTCLTGALLYMASLETDTGNPEFPWAGTVSTITAAATAIVQFGSMIVAAYYLEQTAGKRARDIEAIPDDREVKEADDKAAHLRRCYTDVTQWEVIPCSAKLLIQFSLASIITSSYMVQLFSSLCFTPHSLTDSIDENLDGKVSNLFLPLGWVAVGLFCISIILIYLFESWGEQLAYKVASGIVVSPNQSFDNSPPSFAPERRLSGSGRFDNASSRQTFEDAARRNLATRM